MGRGKCSKQKDVDVTVTIEQSNGVAINIGPSDGSLTNGYAVTVDAVDS